MFTWISRAAALSATAFTLTACADGISVTRRAPEMISVADKSVVVAGPPGYCIDRAASGDRAAGIFVLLGSCASLSRDRDQPHPEDPGILSVTISDATIGAGAIGPLLADLKAFFETPEGRASLSRNGQAGSLELMDTLIEDGALLIHARDRGGRDRGLSDDYWRAFFGIGGRLVTLSVNALSETPLSETAGLQTLREFKTRIRTLTAGTEG